MYEARPRIGEMYLVEAGTMHSVGAGLLLVGRQQPSTSTYRIYDWGRTDDEGNAGSCTLKKLAVRFGLMRLACHNPSARRSRDPAGS